jgi:PAS domain S-box-containing protein
MMPANQAHAIVERARNYMMQKLTTFADMFVHIKRKYYYVATFVFISLVFITFSTLFYNKFNAVQSLNDYSIRQYDLIRQHRVVQADIVDMETGTRGYLLTGDIRFLQPYQEARARLSGDLKLLRELSRGDPANEKRMAEWSGKVDDLVDYLEGGITFRRDRPTATISVVYYEKQKVIMDALRRQLEVGISTNLNALHTHISEARIRKDDLVYSIILVNGLVIGFMLVLTVALFRVDAEHERTRAHVRRQEQLYRTIVEGVNDGVYEFNLVSNELYMSPTYKAMMGYEDHELDNRVEVALSLIHPDDAEKAIAVRSAFLASEDKVYSNIFRMRHKDGSYHWILSRAISVTDQNGNARAMVGTHTDITEQKHREEQLRQLNADLETFTYITSHDMRSPLVNLKGFARELEMSIKELEDSFTRNRSAFSAADQAGADKTFGRDIPEALNFIRYSVDRMDSLTKAILDLSRIGKYQYRFEAVDASEIVEKCLGAQGFQIAQKGIEVAYGDLPVVISDRLALEQIFGNLIDNAIKYMRADIKGHITIGCIATVSDYIFSVADNGRGIHELDHRKIFEIFRRARNTSDVQGQGLGMAYVKATLRKLGGSVTLQSTLGEGTTFFVHIPKTPPHAATLLAGHDEDARPDERAVRDKQTKEATL